MLCMPDSTAWTPNMTRSSATAGSGRLCCSQAVSLNLDIKKSPISAKQIKKSAITDTAGLSNMQESLFSKGYISNVKLSSEGGYQGANILFDRDCDATAWFCSNDMTAIGGHACRKGARTSDTGGYLHYQYR